jgi:YD repeat-containing protein
LFTLGKGEARFTTACASSNRALDHYTYDASGRTLLITQPNSSGSTQYAYSGNTTLVTDPAEKWKKYTRDAFGNLIQVDEPKPGTTTEDTSTYTYDAFDRLKQVSMTRDGNAQTRTWTYDAATQRLTSVTMPESGTTTYTYNANGTLLRKTDAKGQKAEYAYDTLRRVSSIQRFAAGSTTADPCQSVAMYYDTAYLPASQVPNPNQYGHTTQIVSGSVSCFPGQIVERYDYTKSGAPNFKRLIVTRDTGGASGIQSTTLDWNLNFDAHGRPQTEYYPRAINGDGILDVRQSLNHRIDYAYDSMGRLNTLNWADSTTTGWGVARSMVSGVTFNPAGQIAAMTYLSRTESRAYNELM